MIIFYYISMIQLYKGDCLEVMKGILDGSIDAIITDPPYGTTACKWDSVIDFNLMWEQLNRIIKPNGAIVLFGSEPFSSALRMSNIKNYKYDWIWEKDRHTNFLFANKMPLKKNELVSIFYKKLPTYNPQKTKGKVNNSMFKKGVTSKTEHKELMNQNVKMTQSKHDGMKFPSTVQFFKCVGKGKNVHPTQKPVALMEYLIKTYTNENETVLDFTMGSGSTGVAAKNTNRDFIGIEMDDKYFDIATERINNG